MLNLLNIMDSVEEWEMSLKKAASVLMAVREAAYYSPNDPECYGGAICAALDIVDNAAVMLETLKDDISNHLQAERKNITNEKGGVK